MRILRLASSLTRRIRKWVYRRKKVYIEGVGFLTYEELRQWRQKNPRMAP